MKVIFLFVLNAFISASAFANDCSSHTNLKYRCTNNEYVLCVSGNESTPGLNLEIGKHNGSSITLQSNKVKETKKSFSIKERKRVLLVTVNLLDFRLNKETMIAKFRAFYSPLIEIGDGPSWTYNYDEELVCE